MCTDTGRRTWHASIDDVLQLADPCFDVSWGLSFESAETFNSAGCESLTEAWELLRETGALVAVPGNSGSISIGSVTLFATWFNSRGIDQGDAHVDPHMAERSDDLFDQILETEAMSRAA